MKKFIILCISLLFIGQALADATSSLRGKAFWLELVKSHQFTTLDKELLLLQKEYERDVTKERTLLHVMSAFSNSDPLLEKELELWQKSSPDSLFAHLAMGAYHRNLGWLSRGTRWSSETTSQQFAKMRAHFRKAKDELLFVVDKDPKQSIAYTYLISVLSVRSHIKLRDKYLAEGLQNNPFSVVIRDNYINFLQPKWGGSIEEIETFLKESKALEDKNPTLKRLQGFVEYTQGYSLFVSRKETAYKDAIPYFSKAIALYPNAEYLTSRANAYYYLGEYQKSLTDYEASLKDIPQNTRALKGKAEVYRNLKQYDKALKYIDEAISYDKMDPYLLHIRGGIYYTTDKLDEALKDFTDSLAYGYGKPYGHKMLGYIHYAKKNYSVASQELQLAVEFGDKNSYSWYLLTASQWHERDCKFVESANMYERVCQADSSCDEKKLAWALKSAKFAKDRGVCK